MRWAMLTAHASWRACCMQNTMSFDMPSTDEVYIQGLPPDTNEAALAEYFGSIGLIKVDKKTRKPKIWLYRWAWPLRVSASGAHLHLQGQSAAGQNRRKRFAGQLGPPAFDAPWFAGIRTPVSSREMAP